MINAVFLSTGVVHPTMYARRCLRRIMEDTGNVRITRISSIEKAPQALHESANLLVLYLHRQAVSDGALVAIDEFVRRGGGLVAVHSASASFKSHPLFHEILGGRFTGHGRIEPYSATRSSGADGTISTVEEFTVKDELYIHEYADDVSVQYHTLHQGKAEPVIWTRRHGKGRVFYCSLGHRSSSLRNASAASLLRNGIRWAAEGGRS